MSQSVLEPATAEPPASSPKPAGLPERKIVAAIVLGLILAILGAYAVVVRADFIAFDDNSHVFDNAFVKEGLSWHGVREAFTAFHASLWVPLTWISFMADVTFFGLNPGAMHAVNLVWHVASAVLLFFTLRRLTGSLWGSAFVAALFGLHPLNVESVAWITERKNVLNAFFWFAAFAAYARYVEKPRLLPYLATLLFAALALLAKPMAVTLPFTLLLLDFWPLNRWRSGSWPRLVAEKLPFFLLAVGSCWLTMLAPRPEAVVSVETVTLAGRLSNALVSYVAYLGMIFLPVRLGVMYPHPIDPQPVRAALAVVVLLALTGLAVWQRKKRPYLLFGWLWFLGVLVPVLGFVQVGSQARADRFTYIPAIGIFMAVAWLAKDLGRNSPHVLRWTAWPVLTACILLTARQATYWLDGATLFEHTAAVTENNICAYDNAGYHRARGGEPEIAIRNFQAGLRLQPDQPKIWRAFGEALLTIDKPREAIAAFRNCLHYDPHNYSGKYMLALALQKSGETDEAITLFQSILRETPDSGGCHYHLGLALISKGRQDEALQHLKEAVRISAENPHLADALRQLQPTVAKP